MSSLPGVSIIVIGHNEGQHLESCFNAINQFDYPNGKLQIIFVDSNSSDNSVEIAQKYANRIVSIKSNWPTAGEAFNAGIRLAEYDFVHITAGDIQLDKDYLRKAINFLILNSDISAVTGYFTETNNKGWNKILSYRRLDGFEQSEGYSLTPNGGTFRRSAFLKVNGYDERVKKGQETELGLRFKENGLKIWYLNDCQGVHDFDIKNIFELMRRFINDGKSIGHLFFLYLSNRTQISLKPFFKIARRKFALMFFYIVAFLLFIITMNFNFVLVSLVFYLAVLPTKICIKHRKKNRKYVLYLITNSLMAFANYFGIIKFLLTFLRMKLKGIDIFESMIGLKDFNSKVRKVLIIR